MKWPQIVEYVSGNTMHWMNRHRLSVNVDLDISQWAWRCVTWYSSSKSLMSQSGVHFCSKLTLVERYSPSWCGLWAWRGWAGSCIRPCRRWSWRCPRWSWATASGRAGPPGTGWTAPPRAGWSAPPASAALSSPAADQKDDAESAARSSQMAARKASRLSSRICTEAGWLRARFGADLARSRLSYGWGHKYETETCVFKERFFLRNLFNDYF